MKKFMAFMFVIIILSGLSPESCFAESADREVFVYEVLGKKISCSTDISLYIDPETNVLNLIKFAEDHGYYSEMPEDTPVNKVFLFWNESKILQAGLDEKITEDGCKIYQSIRFGKFGYNTFANFERNEKQDSSKVYSVNCDGSYTVNMEQIVLLAYVMENMTEEESDPLFSIFPEFMDFGLYEIPA